MLLGLPYNYWKCPRCGSKYSDGGNPFRTWQPFRNSCLHCELPRWQEPSEWEEITPSVPDRSFSPHVRAPVDLMIKVRDHHRHFLTLVLRDDPGVIGLKMDTDGWVKIEDLLKKSKRNGIKLELEDLDYFSEDRGLLEKGGFKTLVRLAEPGGNV